MTTTAKFPTALLALVDVGGEVADIKTAILSGAHNNSITTITLTATVPTEWPTAGWVTIDGEIIKYAGKSGATLTSCTRGDQSTYGGGVAASHSDQAIVGPYLTAQQVNQVFAEIIALEKWEGNATPVATIASSGTTDLSTLTSRYAQVTGTTTITAFGTVNFTRLVILEFAGILTLTHNATSLILRSGANATTAAGDVYAFVSEGSGNWREVWHLTSASATLPDSDPTLQSNYWRYTYTGEYAPVETTVSGTGTVAAATPLTLRRYDTGATSGSVASSRVVLRNLTVWAIGKIRRLEIQCDFVHIDANTSAYVFLTTESATTAPSLTANHIGIKNIAGVVRFSTADGATEQTTDISSFVAATTDKTYVVDFDGTTAKLYIDGVLRATHATNVPVSTLNAAPVWRTYIVNAAAASKQVDIDRIDALFACS